MSQSATEQITISVNGAPRQLPAGSNVVDLIAHLGLRRELVAVEIDRRIIRRATHEQRILAEGERIEVVEFVGGG